MVRLRLDTEATDRVPEWKKVPQIFRQLFKLKQLITVTITKLSKSIQHMIL